MVRLKINKENLLYMILFTGVFSDALRIQGTVITFYRVLMIIGFAVAVSICPKKLTKWAILLTSLLLFNILQGFLFTSRYNIVKFIPGRILKYEYFYFCIGITVMILYAIYWRQGKDFLITCRRFIYFFSVCNTIIFALYQIIGYEWATQYFTNVNDYGASLAAFFPILWTDAMNRRKLKYYLFAMAIIVLEYLNDCKLCCIGIMAEVVVIAFMYGYRYGKRWGLTKIMSRIGIVLIIFVVVYIVASDAVLMGSPVGALLIEPIHRIVTCNLYPTSNSSGMFRVNVFITGITWSLKTLFAGMGAGNATMLVKNYLSDYSVYETAELGLSVHNSWMEFLLDFGFIALIIYLLVIKFGIKAVSQVSKRLYYVPAVVCSLTIWIWGMQSAGSYTNYGMVMILFYYVIRVRKENTMEDAGCENN